MTSAAAESDAGRGIATWGSAQWRRVATAWLDERLAAAGVERTGEVTQPHLRPWATVLRADTTRGPVWLKATGSGTAFETPLYELLARTVPDRVLTPIGLDARRGWILLPDGGPPLGERLEGAELVDALVGALARYGRLQRELEPAVDDLLAAGVADMRPAAMPRRLDEALAAVAGDGAGDEVGRRVVAMRPTVAGWCERLAASPVPASLDHNDLHPWNILGEAPDRVRYYDWGDSVVAHPFAATLVPLGFVQRGLDAALDDPRLLRARDAYLDAFDDLGSRAELAETLELACRVGKVARALTWHRAVRSAREQGEEIEPYYAAAPRQTLAAVGDDSYLGGA